MTFDSELDSIFSSTFAQPPPKLTKVAPAAQPEPSNSKSESNKKASKKESKSPDEPKSSRKRKEPPASSKSSKKPSKAVAATGGQSSDDSEDDSELEERYAAQNAAKRLKQASKHSQAAPFASAKGNAAQAQARTLEHSDSSDSSQSDQEDDGEEDDDDDDDNASETETISIGASASDSEHSDAESSSSSSSNGNKEKKKTKTPKKDSAEKPKALSKQDRAEQDKRTVFVGNVPLATALTRPARKTFQRFVHTHLAALPENKSEEDPFKLDSLRFRSLPLDVTGAKDQADVAHSSNKSGAQQAKQADINSHSSQRAQHWKTQNRRRGALAADDDDDTAPSNAGPAKSFLTAQQKRKVAYITGGQGKSKEGAQEAEKGGGSCSAYAVLSHAVAVKPLVKALDGALFEERTLRSDAVDASKKAKLDKSDERRTVFVGGVDVQESEESLRAWVEQLLVEAKGQAKAQTGDADHWVQRVRMIRDPKTGLGKGFAYVLLHDGDCVDELLTIESSKLKLSKRKLRFERCKSSRLQAMKVAGIKSDSTDKGKKADAKGKKKDDKSSNKGDKKPQQPRLPPPKKQTPEEKKAFAQQLASLSKDERKAAKATDVDRVARRLEKRQSKRDSVKQEKRTEKKGQGLLKAVGRKLDGAMAKSSEKPRQAGGTVKKNKIGRAKDAPGKQAKKPKKQS